MAAHSRWAVAPPTIYQRSIEELDAAIFQCELTVRDATYQSLVLVREFDERCGWSKWSFATCAEWLAWRCGMSRSAARERVRTAHALRTLPSTSAAFADGRLSYSKVRALTRVANEHNEDLLLAYALEATQTQVEQRCAQIRNTAPESIDVAQRAWQRRSLCVSRNVARGTVLIRVELPAAEGELVAKALDRAVAMGEVARGIEFGADRESASTSWGAQQADALVAVSKSYLAGGEGAAEGPSASVSADHCQVVIHVDESALRGAGGRSDLPLETIKRLTCDCSLVAVVEDAKGNPLDVGRKQRNVSAALRRALWARDRGCTFPGCDRKRYVHAHHIRHWVNHGETTPDNLALLCSFHHGLLHEGGFRMRKAADGATYFERPDGRVIPRGGYRVEDMADDTSGGTSACADENPSMEGFAERHSTEVRERRAVYQVGRPTLQTVASPG